MRSTMGIRLLFQYVYDHAHGGQPRDLQRVARIEIQPTPAVSSKACGADNETRPKTSHSRRAAEICCRSPRPRSVRSRVYSFGCSDGDLAQIATSPLLARRLVSGPPGWYWIGGNSVSVTWDLHGLNPDDIHPDPARIRRTKPDAFARGHRNGLNSKGVEAWADQSLSASRSTCTI